MMQMKQAAKELNTTPRTIRFYEHKGLVFPKKGEQNDYRSYTDSDLVRLSTILSLREIGFSVNAIKNLLDNEEMSIRQYLNIQRSALYDKWHEIKDMIQTIDQMIDRVEEDDNVMWTIHALASQLEKDETHKTQKRYINNNFCVFLL